MRRLLLAALLPGLLVVSCANKKLDRLSEAEADHYAALRVWMEEPELKAWLKLKTEDERNQWLKDHGYWDRFYQYDQGVRDEIVAGHVAVGWKQDMVQMAWGPPHTRMRSTGRQVAGRSETFLYRFEVTAEGQVLVWAPKSKETHRAVDLYRVEVIIDNGVVAELIKKDGWE